MKKKDGGVKMKGIPQGRSKEFREEAVKNEDKGVDLLIWKCSDNSVFFH
jgi:hypothetical protein